ncbi:MAG: class I SAM-dependent methyltransferase [Nitrospirae bacterium]|nr:class I SAM-dependent methyltransferase [Nitrospirota bacterium]MCL5236814.1 class I SAM-dependent methyltransferase [Nitrospirota bacterium]
MDYTGERYIPGVEGGIAYEHVHRYAFACGLISGKEVLDIACGEGYGSSLLAKRAKGVIGVDISDEAISHAIRKYGNQKNLEFRVGSCTDMPCADESFDIVVSFETIEHIAGQKRMLDEVKRVLRKPGILIISSPNKKTNSDNTGLRNEFHIRELYLAEFANLLHSRFKYVNMMGQRLTLSSYMWPLDLGESKGSSGFVHFSGDYSGINVSTPPFDPLFFIAICSNAGNQDENRINASLYTDRNDSLYTYFTGLSDRLTEALHYEAILNSWSWKITAPLRWLRRKLWDNSE